MSTFRKAIFAGVAALLGSFATALADGNLTPGEIIGAVLTAVVAGLGTYQITNEAPGGGAD